MGEFRLDGAHLSAAPAGTLPLPPRPSSWGRAKGYRIPICPAEQEQFLGLRRRRLQVASRTANASLPAHGHLCNSRCCARGSWISWAGLVVPSTVASPRRPAAAKGHHSYCSLRTNDRHRCSCSGGLSVFQFDFCRQLGLATTRSCPGWLYTRSPYSSQHSSSCRLMCGMGTVQIECQPDL